MQAFTSLTGAAAPLLRDNIDTDVIIRIERMTGTARDSMGAFAFESLRFRPDGSEDAGFVLNWPAYRGAPILLAGANFGCGSSREGAVWALAGMGLRCIIAESFGDIFYSNCFQNGLLPIRLAGDAVRQLAAAGPVTVDLAAQSVTAPSLRFEFEIEPMRKAALLEGIDDIGLTLKHADAIASYQAADRAARPWVWPTARADGPA